MKLLLFGATGMVGKGVLVEALKDPAISQVLCVSRTTSGVTHEKLKEIIAPDLFHVNSILDSLPQVDACIWALGISSVGMKEADYERITATLTLDWAKMLLKTNPGLSFAYCSAAGAGGSSMWARVRQRVESQLLATPFKHVGIVRPAAIKPGPGIKSRTRLYQAFIILFKPIFPILLKLAPGFMTSSERLGQAMLAIVKGKVSQKILESKGINESAGSSQSLGVRR
jgi:uncharacterized protein YbjT (DUF2867 family)